MPFEFWYLDLEFFTQLWRRNCASDYVTATDLEDSVIEENPLIGLQIGHNRNFSKDPKSVRELFISYFNMCNNTNSE